MKRNLLVLMLCLGFIKIAVAQKDSLEFDEHGKYIFYRIANVNQTDANVLMARGLGFFNMPVNKVNFKVTTKDANAHTFDGSGFLMISNATSLSKHDDGKITFKLRVEIKDGKYRYWLTDFVFIPYYKDRYNNLVPQPGIEIPLEKITSRVNNKDAGHYIDECGAFSLKLNDRLKRYMQTGPVKTDNSKKVIKIDKW